MKQFFNIAFKTKIVLKKEVPKKGFDLSKLFLR